jgi:hypothetical protein
LPSFSRTSISVKPPRAHQAISDPTQRTWFSRSSDSPNSSSLVLAAALRCMVAAIHAGHQWCKALLSISSGLVRKENPVDGA